MSESVGGQLRAAREARGLSVQDIAGQMKIPARYVSALETDDVAALPEPTFVRGYIKTYARVVGLDPDALLAASVPVEVRAPRPLLGPEGQAGSSRRASAQVRAPSFRSGSSRSYLLIAVAALVVAVIWFLWPAGTATDTPAVASPVVPSPAVPVVPAAGDATTGTAVTLEVPLPGVVPAAPPPSGSLPADPVATRPVASPQSVPGSAPLSASPAAPMTASPVAAVPAAPAVPAKGLYARFSGTCWVEVRDADNVVLHTRIAMAGNELTVDGKAPLTVTLGDAAAAEVWYNGERVVADRFSSNGIARLILGQVAR